MANPTLITRSSPHARGNLVRVTLAGTVLDHGLVLADSSAGLVRLELAQDDPLLLSPPGGATLVSKEPLLGKDRFLATFTGAVVFSFPTPLNQDVVVEQGRPTVTPPSEEVGPRATPWAAL